MPAKWTAAKGSGTFWPRLRGELARLGALRAFNEGTTRTVRGAGIVADSTGVGSASNAGPDKDELRAHVMVVDRSWVPYGTASRSHSVAAGGVSYV